MDDVPHPSRLVAFVRALGVLAASSKHQLAWLDALGPVASWNVSELGLEFDDGYRLADQWTSAGWLPESSRAPIAALNELLDQMSGEGNAALWTREALARHQAWRDVRDLAFAVLATLS